MTDNKTVYLEDIGASRTLRNRVTQLMEYYAVLVPEPLLDIFVTDYLNDDGVRQFENLWFFSAHAIGECHAFLEKDEFDSVPRSRLVLRWLMQSEHYDFKRAVDASRLNVKATVQEGATMTFKASGANCDFLMKILKEYVVPPVDA